jgi:hypothetical protein
VKKLLMYPFVACCKSDSCTRDIGCTDSATWRLRVDKALDGVLGYFVGISIGAAAGASFLSSGPDSMAGTAVVMGAIGGIVGVIAAMGCKNR